MKNHRGVVVLAVLFIGLFAALVGIIVGAKKPMMLAGREVEATPPTIDGNAALLKRIREYQPSPTPTPVPAQPVFKEIPALENQAQ